MNFVHDPTSAIEGVLWASNGPWLTFRDVTALKENKKPVQMLGEVVIERSRVAFMQVLS